MIRTSQIISAVTIILALGAFAPSARADSGCGPMLMPAAQLKTTARGFSSFHAGVDLIAPYGSPVRAAMAGRVIFAGVFFGYGNMVDLEHEDGTVTRYGHLSAFAPGLQVGHELAVGETLGRIGTSGHAHGAHLHFEVRVGGRAVNPQPFLASAGCPTSSGTPTEEARAPEGRPGGLFQ